MTQSPILWGAGLACALGGAIAGNAVGTTPVIDRPASENYYQTHRDTVAGEQRSQVLPDRYPLLTKSGVVPVEQLSDRGLFSQARYRSFVAYTAPYPDDPGPAPAFDEAAPAAFEVEPSDADRHQIAAIPGAVQGPGKIIDVQATLAMQ